MKRIIFLIVFFLVISCNNNNQTIPTTFSLKSAENVLIKNNMAFLGEEKYSGFIFEMNDKDTISISGYLNGKLEGISKKWYTNNQLQETRYYSNGQKNGKQLSFWNNGNKRFEFIAKKDAYDGALKEWSEDGKLFRLANYENGREKGVQKLWYPDGKIRANYVIVDGRRYGLLGTKNCVNVSDSIFSIN